MGGVNEAMRGVRVSDRGIEGVEQKSGWETESVTSPKGVGDQWLQRQAFCAREREGDC